MSKRRILITGSSGMLANAIIPYLRDLEDITLVGIDRDVRANPLLDQNITGNLTDLDWLSEMLERSQPEIIVNTAAIVSLDKCEKSPLEAQLLHVDAARLMSKYSNRIVHVSTDSVFNGHKGGYTETDIPDPINEYSKSKLLGEYAIAEANANHVIIRTNIFGFNRPLRNSLAEWAIRNLSSDTEIEGYTNVLFNAIYIGDLAKILVKLIDMNLRGVINLASENTISKYQFLKLVAEIFNYDKALIHKKYYENKLQKIRRPLNTSLNIHKAQKYINIPTVEQGIAKMCADYQGV
jgi:dTDP-4-dehydrorhamnose reductase